MKFIGTNGILFHFNPMPTLIFKRFAAFVSIVLLSLAPLCMAEEYYIDSNMSPQAVSKISLSPGDSVFFQRGLSSDEGFTIKGTGNQHDRIFIGAYDSGSKPIVGYIKINGNYITVSNLIIDRQKAAADAIQVTGTNCTLSNLEVRNGTRDGIDVKDADNLLVENCHIHHFLNGSFTDQADAHGIAITESIFVTIRETEIHHVSGDSVQADPNRNASDMTNHVTIDNCHFWTGPLNQNYNSGWVKTSHLPDSEKQYPGENAIDTKVVKNGWNAVSRMQITINNSRFHGWKKDGYISNKAALNLKEKVEITISGSTIYDNEIGLRLRGSRGNANVTVNNTHIFNCIIAVRTEDSLENLTIMGSIFGDNIGTQLLHVASSSGFNTWKILNNYFLNSKPEQASDPSNRIISEEEYAALINKNRPLAPQNLIVSD